MSTQRRANISAQAKAIFFAGHSFESLMKVLTKLEHANGDKLIKELGSQGFFDDLPESVQSGFMDQVLRALFGPLGIPG